MCIESEEWVGYGIVFNYCLLLRWWNRMAILLPPALFFSTPPTQQKNKTFEQQPNRIKKNHNQHNKVIFQRWSHFSSFYIFFIHFPTLHYNWRIYIFYILIENCIEFYIHNAGMKLIKNVKEESEKKGGEYNEGGFSV